MAQKNLLDLPEWPSRAVVYQIFPDRFLKSGYVKSQENLLFEPWGSEPSAHGFQGGDLYGIINSLDYLEDIGITCIYLNPIFSSAANHRYHTYDYFNVDPLLGGNQALEALITALHKREMKIILDGVFNHCGRGFWAFHNLLENGHSSPYRDWFEIHKWPLNPYPNKGEDCGYSCWWNDPALPKFNHSNPDIQNYLLDVATFWTLFGIDGWRLDVPEEIPIDFWEEFRARIKSLNSEAWIVGEIWKDARPWLKGKHFDGVMNYRIGWSTLSWVAGNSLNKNYINPSYPLIEISSSGYIDVLKTTFGWYRSEINRCQLNLLDSHDVPRALHTLNGDTSKLKLALFLLFIQPGAPCIYYGTELALMGGVEPKCREAFTWNEVGDHQALRNFIQSLISFRKVNSDIFRESWIWDQLGTDGLIATNYELKKYINGQEILAILINRSTTKWMKFKLNFINDLFSVGDIEVDRRVVGPMSAVLFSCNKNISEIVNKDSISWL